MPPRLPAQVPVEPEIAAQLILRDLEAAGYVTKERVGRRNEYRLDAGRYLRHPAESTVPVTSLLNLFESR